MALLSDNMIVINNLYEIKVSSNKTNLNYNESATITVQAVDFNGVNITGKQIKITVDKGNFINGNTNLGKSYTGTTGANGFTVSYKANESGIINFNCTIIETLTGLNDILDGAMYEGGNQVSSQVIIGFDQAIDWTGVTVTGATLNPNPNTNCVYGAYCYQLVNVTSSGVLFEKEGCYPLLLENGTLNEITQLSYDKSSNLQLFASAYEKIILAASNADGGVTLYVNKYTRHCMLQYISQVVVFRKGDSSTGLSKTLEAGLIPSSLSQYRPPHEIRESVYRPDIVFILNSSGDLKYRVEIDNKSCAVKPSATFYWYY